jgi:hypothetical protein
VGQIQYWVVLLLRLVEVEQVAAGHLDRLTHYPGVLAAAQGEPMERLVQLALELRGKAITVVLVSILAQRLVVAEAVLELSGHPVHLV